MPRNPQDRFDVMPLHTISITNPGGKHWNWCVSDINAKKNGRLWHIASNEGYDDPREALEDALVAFEKAEREAGMK